MIASLIQLRIFRNWNMWIDTFLLFVFFLFIAPLIIPRFLLIDILSWSIVVYGFSLLYGFLGYLSFGHLAYFAVGAYTFACTVRFLHIDPLLGIIIALLAGVATGALFGLVTVRKGGAYFALTNLSVSVVVYYIVLYFLKDYTGGFEGKFIDLRHGIIDLSSRETAFLAVLILFTLVFLFYKILSKSTFVLLLQAIKENEDRVKFLGYNTFLIKYIAFIVSTMFSALGGAALVLSHSYVSATTYTPAFNGEIVIMSMLGGASSIYGPIIGTAMYLGLKYVIGSYIIRWELVIGTILLVSMILAKGLGICGIFEKLLKTKIKLFGE
uniref:Branched-chain amino acid ABC transporter permease n=1 Tax=Ignisphaera aggregans TaxID=334771 RepID=A0A7J3QEK6_9CREN